MLSSEKDDDTEATHTDGAAGALPGPSGGRALARKPAGQPFQLYLPGQGATVRWCTAVGAALIALAAASFLHDQLRRFAFIADSLWLRMLIPVAVLAGLSYLIFHYVGQHRGFVEFLIATEHEMKKVSWSTRREVFGATRVVIITVLLLGTILFLVDLAFMLFFDGIGVLRVGSVLGYMFGGGDGAS